MLRDRSAKIGTLSSPATALARAGLVGALVLIASLAAGCPTRGGGSEMRGDDRKAMVYVPAGTAAQGSSDEEATAALAQCKEADVSGCQDHFFADELPRREVTLDAFWIDTHEVSNAEYDRCVARGACRAGRFGRCQRYTPADGWLAVEEAAARRGFGAPEQPAVCVSWFDAATYCRWAAKRLPTEAEWERTARGDDGRIYPWGNEPPACERAVFDAGGEVGPGCGSGTTAAIDGLDGDVRGEGASPYGVLDMAGNVSEWVQDGYQADYYASAPRKNPINELGDAHVRSARGGSWSSRQPFLRAANRGGFEADTASVYVGLRCAMDDD